MEAARGLNRLGKILETAVLAAACVSVVLLLYASTLPQYGDGAIGTLWVFLAAASLYLIEAVLAVGVLVMRAWRPEAAHRHAAWIVGALGLPVIVWLSLGVLF